MAVGTIKVYSPSRGSGWIRPDSGGSLVYVHKSGIVREVEGAAPRFAKGDRVEFQIGQRDKGPAAINVRPVSAAAAPAAELAEVSPEESGDQPAEAEAAEEA